MRSKIRKSPPVCLLYALAGLMSGKLQLSSNHLGSQLTDERGKVFEIFRNIRKKTQAGAGMGAITNIPTESEPAVVFVVSFKFARLSHRANKLASIIPMLMIAGFPGFVQKLYGVDAIDGYWMGLYAWRSPRHLEAYKKSLVFRVMQKRAVRDSILMNEYHGQSVLEFISRGGFTPGLSEASHKK